jgi:hypothetical protein
MIEAHQVYLALRGESETSLQCELISQRQVAVLGKNRDVEVATHLIGGQDVRSP